MNGFLSFTRTPSCVGGPACERLAAIAAMHAVWLVIGVQEREVAGSSIYNTVLYFSPEGELVERHRKLLVPPGSERTVWPSGDGSTLNVRVTPTSAGRQVARSADAP